jgi:hypothetical protein
MGRSLPVLPFWCHGGGKKTRFPSPYLFLRAMLQLLSLPRTYLYNVDILETARSKLHEDNVMVNTI